MNFGDNEQTPLRLREELLAVICLIFLTGYSCGDDLKLGQNATTSSTSSTSSSSTSSSGSSDSSLDSDGDGLSDQVELTFGLDPKKADTDNDGYGDGLEFVGRNSDPLDPTRIPSVFAKERTLTARAVTTGDSDKDGLSDNFETANGLDPNNPDTDGDGYSDALELVAGSNPFDASDRPKRSAAPNANGSTVTGAAPSDRDGDGLSDSVEAQVGTRSDVADSDSDGFSDGLERLMGSDSNDPFSVPNFVVPSKP